jgi:replicative DNA helicase
MIIAKNRNGPTGTITCYFNGQLTRFEDFDIEEF